MLNHKHWPHSCSANVGNGASRLYFELVFSVVCASRQRTLRQSGLGYLCWCRIADLTVTAKMQGDAMSRNRIGMFVSYTSETCLAKCVPALCRAMQLRRPNAGGRDLEKSQSCEKCCVSLTTLVAQSFLPSFFRGPRVPVDSRVKCAPQCSGVQTWWVSFFVSPSRVAL